MNERTDTQAEIGEEGRGVVSEVVSEAVREARIEAQREAQREAGRESGIETVALQDAMPDETTTTDHLGETEISLMNAEVEVDDAAIGEVVMVDMEVEVLSKSAREAQALHQRRRNRLQT